MNTRTEGGPLARVAVMSDLSTQIEGLADKSLLLLDDDTALRTRLGRALEGRGFEPVLAASVTEALAAVKVYPPAFAVAPEFPTEVLPEDPGLIVADAFGGAVLREAPVASLAGARRKALTVAFGRLAALRAGAALSL